jgi:ABC-2 type transport system ATP-binding protein
MRTGSVVFHGRIAHLREQAPEQGHRLATADDDAARALAHPGLRLRAHPEGGLVAVGPQDALDAYVAALARAGIPLRRLEPTETPLEALFFMLTETAPGGVPRELVGAAR